MPKLRQSSLMLLPALLLLVTACETVRSDCSPSLVLYSKEFQTKAFLELQANDIPTIEQMLDDYHKLRLQVKACQGE